VQRFGDIEARLFVCDGYDSALRLRFADGRTFLNLNDARVELDGVLDAIRADAAGADLVALQFSYANYAGNRGDTQIPRDQHESVLARVLAVADALRPKAMMLFASYVYVSHAENFYWNQHFWLQEMVDALEARGIKAIVPQPDQRIALDGLETRDLAEDNRRAIAFWTERHHAARPVDAEAQCVGLDALQTAYRAFRARLWADNDLPLARRDAAQDLRLRVKLSDQDTVIELGLLDEHFQAHTDHGGDSPHDVIVSSNTLLFLLEHKFARGTVSINSRLQFHYPTAHRFFMFFFIHYANNIGRHFRAGGLSWASLRSIANVAVLQSIVKFHPECQHNLHADLARLGVQMPVPAPLPQAA
jgi:hypothetical protein